MPALCLCNSACKRQDPVRTLFRQAPHMGISPKSDGSSWRWIGFQACCQQVPLPQCHSSLSQDGARNAAHLRVLQHAGVPIMLQGCQLLVVRQHLCCCPLHLLRLCSLY